MHTFFLQTCDSSGVHHNMDYYITPLSIICFMKSKMFLYQGNAKAVVNCSQVNLQACLRNSNAVIGQTQQSCVCAQQTAFENN